MRYNNINMRNMAVSGIENVKKYLDVYPKHDKSFEYLINPINEITDKQYFKNGNIKDYIDQLSIPNYDKNIIVSKRDYNVFRTEVADARQYLSILYLSIFYQEKIILLLKSMNDFYKQAAYFHNISSYVDQTESYVCQKEFSSNRAADLDEPLKPDVRNIKYYSSSFFSFIPFVKRRKEKKHLILYRAALEQYYSKYQDFEVKKYSFYKNEYDSMFAAFIKAKSGKEKAEEIFSLKRGFCEFASEAKIRKYVDCFLSLNNRLPWFYSDLSFSYSINIDTKSISINLEIPLESIFPCVKGFNIIRKTLTAKEIYFTKEEIAAQNDASLNSFVLYYVLLFKKLDISTTFKTLYINLFSKDNTRTKKDIFVPEYRIAELKADIEKEAPDLNDGLTVLAEQAYRIYLHYSDLAKETMEGEKHA